MPLNFCKIIILILILGLGSQASKAQPYAWNQLSNDFAPSPLDLRVGAYGDIQIWRDGNAQGQLYHPDRDANGVVGWSMYNGIMMNVGGDTYVSYSGALAGYTDYFTGGVSDITGSGTSADPWRLEVDLSNNSSSQYGFNVAYIYINGTEYFDIELTPFVPNSNNEVVKVYHLLDTYISSSDDGPAYTSGTDPYDVVGVLAADGSTFEAFVVTEDPWDRYCSQHYYTTLNEPFYDQELSNTLDTDPTTDNAIGIQWTLGVVKGTRPTIKYRVGFTADIGSIIGCEKSYINKNRARTIKASGG